MFIGQVFEYAGAGALPPKCLACDGSRYLQAAYPELFGVLGFSWGPDNGDGTFPLPNDLNKVSYGAGQAYLVGQAVGSDSPTLNANQVPAHTHPVVVTDPGHTHPPANVNKWMVHRNNAGGVAELGPALAGAGPLGTDGQTGSAATGITATAGNNVTAGNPLDVRQAGNAYRKAIYAGR
jgi:microcystin-dependent protein